MSFNNYYQIRKYAVINLVSELMYSPENLAMNETDRRIIERAEIKFLKYISRHNIKFQGRKMNIRQILKIYDLNKIILG
jgi:hypothetical protein